MSRCVCVGPPAHANRPNDPKPGIYSKMQWRKGGLQAAAFPLNIKCDTEDEATEIFRVFQPWVLQNYDKPPSVFTELLTDDKVLQRLASALDSTNWIYWSVKLGGTVGIYFDGRDAMASLKAGREDRFRRAFAYSHFLDAVSAMVSTGDSMPSALYDYNPSKDPSNAAAIHQVAITHRTSLSHPQPAPSSPAPSPTTVTLTPTPASPSSVHITVSSFIGSQSQAIPETPTRRRVAVSRQGTPIRETREAPRLGNWLRRYLEAHGYDADDVSEIEGIVLKCTGVEQFIGNMQQFLSVSDEILHFMWDMQNM
ncbi:hypothetical protein VKT23_012388 [Stygiomarasmius scandens]|uniref:Uncharacterized protein n=1 Tax=Marasmiellus scandens TaxID=2682957 RepID=A0ABR1JAK5_9AGAR